MAITLTREIRAKALAGGWRVHDFISSSLDIPAPRIGGQTERWLILKYPLYPTGPPYTMAPKRSQTNGDRTGNASNEHSGPGNLETKDSNRKKARSAAGNKKRKAHDETTSGASSKAPRRSVRSTPGDLSSQEQVRLLNFLLSPTCVPLTRPADERKDVEARGGDDKVKTYSVSNFTPLEELIGAMILSRPIGRMSCNCHCSRLLNSLLSRT